MSGTQDIRTVSLMHTSTLESMARPPGGGVAAGSTPDRTRRLGVVSEMVTAGEWVLRSVAVGEDLTRHYVPALRITGQEAPGTPCP